MPLLRKRLKANRDATAPKVEGKKSKRQRFVDFFKQKKNKEHGLDTQKPISQSTSERPHALEKDENDPLPQTQKPTDDRVPTETDENEASEKPMSQKQEEEVQPLNEEQIFAIFSGAPHFGIARREEGAVPIAAFPWDDNLAIKDVSDSPQMIHPAFSASTLRRHLPVLGQPSDQDKQYLAYDVSVIERPSMLSAQGVEPGTVGFVHFLELPISDALATDAQESEPSSGFLESTRNKELMQSKPERLGIRPVDTATIYDRLLELGDLIEVFQDSPERMTMLNNQSSGDLYANLFGKFLTPPAYDDTADDPTGMKVQINTLLKILRLRGVWYDFSLVEWRIRLGQILWSEPLIDSLPATRHDQLWTERDILLLQITLGCELLLRLDAVTSMDPSDVRGDMHVNPDDLGGFLNLKNKKVEWDLILARRFLDNILVMEGPAGDVPVQSSKPRGLLSILSRDGKDEPKSAPPPEIVLLPRHQARQLSGLLCFAERLQWPGLDELIKELASKLGVSPSQDDPTSPYKKFLDPSIASVSVYGTPMATPRSIASGRDSYFGTSGRPALETRNSQSLTVPLTAALLVSAPEVAANTMSIGGWLSRSYLTGLILPGEAICHFLISTLLENDKAAIAALGDSANLYGGFVYADRSWWSKSCIVGRVVACMEGAVECMGWISVPKVPEVLPDGWYSIKSEPLPHEEPYRVAAEEDMVYRDSAFVPGGNATTVKPGDLALPDDSATPPVPSVVLSDWSLTPCSPEPPQNDEAGSVPSAAETHVATLTFASLSRGTPHALPLLHDVQFVTSYPCTAPAKTPGTAPEIVKASPSRSSSKRSTQHNPKDSNKRLSRLSSRRSSHGFEPLFSHPPDSPSITPKRAYSPVPGAPLDEISVSTPMMAHPLHISYKYIMVPVTDVLDPNFSLPLRMAPHGSASSSSSGNEDTAADEVSSDEDKTVVVLDARAAKDLELLARAWCAQKGFHAIVGRCGRTCLACCIREARGLGVRVVIRV
ncbi:hypothetical protein M011DRAFT_426263 [Sporormia fimetaria CBS 119925]|uniref:Uncharacterized protein n=1 Tax=Sporormia fimetaria CBS 119925 TaxID=1340428 RepID=A0A6A6V9H8_9PLEO|nr:hypothetical protein M011DRAFT_426263 [Sporormia fimetaria CBS 119925]